MSLPKLFQNRISRHSGLARPNKYQVFLPNLEGFNEEMTDFDILCQSIEIPGRNINIIERKVNAYTTKHAGDVQIDNVNMSFIETGDSIIQRYFQHWFHQIVSPRYGTVAYKKSIAHDIRLKTFTEAGQSPSEENINLFTIIRNCWPQTRPSIEYSDSERDSPLIVTVNFACDNFRSDQPGAIFVDIPPQRPNAPAPPERGFSIPGSDEVFVT